MEQSKFKVAYVITERNDKTYWNRIGVAFTNKVKLDALPTGGTLQIRDYEPRDDADDAIAPPRTQRGLGTRAASEQAL
jgi:hypothetical protein